MIKYLFLLIMLSPSAFACWNLKAVIEVEKEQILIDQKINHDQIYSFSQGDHIFHLKVPSKENWPKDVPKEEGQFVEIEVVKKENNSLRKLPKAQMLLKEGQEGVMRVGENGQDLFNVKMTLKNI